MGTFLSERIVNYRCFIAGHGNRYSTLGASNNNRSTHTIDFHLSSHELLRIAIVAVLVYRVTTNIAAANGTGIIAGCNCDMGVLLSFSLTAVEGIDNITSLRLGRITNFVDAVFTKQLLATTVSRVCSANPKIDFNTLYIGIKSGGSWSHVRASDGSSVSADNPPDSSRS